MGKTKVTKVGKTGITERLRQGTTSAGNPYISKRTSFGKGLPAATKTQAYNTSSKKLVTKERKAGAPRVKK